MTIFTAWPIKYGATLFRRRTEHVTTRMSNFVANGQRFVLPLHIVYLKMVSLLGEEHACTLLEHIGPQICQEDIPVLEMRAGEGFLTKKLLDAGVRNLHIFEKRNTCRPSLQEIVSKHPGKCTLHFRTFNDVFLEDNNIPIYTSPYLEKSLPFKCKKSWKDSPSIKVIGAHSSGKVMIVALIHLCKNMMYFGMGRPQFILSIPGSAWEKLIKNPKKVNYQDYQTAGFLFPDFFEYEILGTVAPPVHLSSGENATHVSKEEYVTVSLAPTKELEDFISPQDLEEYLFFGTQTMNGKAKHSYIIPSLERWAPGSGKDLVVNGVNCFTQYTDLTPREALRVFSIWKSLPNYSSSLFMYELKDYLQYNKY